MATKKKTKKVAKKPTTKTTRKPAARKSNAGSPRACSVCSEKGHNKRSHDPGGRLAKGSKRAK